MGNYTGIHHLGDVEKKFAYGGGIGRPIAPLSYSFGGSGPDQQSGSAEAPATPIPGLGASGIRPGMGSPGTNYGNIGNGNAVPQRNTGNGGLPIGAAAGAGAAPIGGTTWAGNPIKGGQLFRSAGYKAGFANRPPGDTSRRIGGDLGNDMRPGQGGMMGGDLGNDMRPGQGGMMGGLLGGGRGEEGTRSGGAPAGTSFGAGGQAFAPGAYNPDDPYGMMPGYAHGGVVDGPGGPKDDMIPARLSDGEFIMPAEAVEFFGTQKLNKMIEQAREGEGKLKVESGKLKPEMMLPPTPNPQPPAPMMPGFAAGGLVDMAQYYRDPRNVVMREQEARDARLGAMGITDAGMGHMTLRNKYGSGFAVPGTQAEIAAPGIFNNQGLQARLQPEGGFGLVPDVVPSGQWAAPGMWDDPKARRAEIDAQIPEIMRSARERRLVDMTRRENQVRPQFVQAGKDGPWLPKDDGLLPNVDKARAAEARLALQSMNPEQRAQQRDARVAAAKADGSFEKIRENYNNLNNGHFMDSSGSITESAKAGYGDGGFYESSSPEIRRLFRDEFAARGQATAPRPLSDFETSWERRQREAAMREAMNPLAGLGLSKTQQRRFMQTPQGQRFVQDQIEQSTPDEWLPIPGTNHLQSKRTGQVVGMAGAGEAMPFNPADFGMVPDSVTRGGVRYAKPKAESETIKITNPNGDLKDWPADLELPPLWEEVRKKQAAASAESGVRSPESGGKAGSREFKSWAEAEKSDIPKGTIITINGKRYKKD